MASQETEKVIDTLIVGLWNDIVNRQAGKVIFEDSKDILAVRQKLIDLIDHIELSTKLAAQSNNKEQS